MRWHLLGPEKEQDGGCLRGLSFIDREMVQPRRRSAEKNAQDLEQIDYVLAGAGHAGLQRPRKTICEGDTIHLRPQTTYHLTNAGETWLTYLIIAAR